MNACMVHLPAARQPPSRGSQRMLRQTIDPTRSSWRQCFALSLALCVSLTTAAGAETAPAPEPPVTTGTLRAPYPEFDLLLAPVQAARGSGGGVLRVEGRGGEARVAAGAYDLLEWRVYVRDAA